MTKNHRPWGVRAVCQALALGAVFAAIAALPAAAGAVTLPSTKLGSGSDVTFHVQSALDLLYNESPGCNIVATSGTQPLDFSCLPQAGDITTENYYHDRITEAAPIGGSAGINQLCKQTLAGVASIAFTRQTSAPSASACTGLRYVAYGRDALTFETFPNAAGAGSAGVTNLTQAQLQGIFVSCTITNWNQVGGIDAPIKVYTIRTQFGTRKAWDTFLGGSSSSCPGVQLVDQTDNSGIAPADLGNAIVPVSVGSWTERYGVSGTPDGSVLGSVDGVTPTISNIQNGTFPYGRFIYNVYCAGDPATLKCGTASPASSATTKYLGAAGWLCKNTHAADPITGVNYRAEIESTILRFGFAPLPKGATGGGTTYTNYCRQFTT